MGHRHWSQEEIEYLEDSWGALKRTTIAKKLNRSASAVLQKAQRLGLGDARTHIDGITISQLSVMLNTHYGILKNWIHKYGMPAKQKIVANQSKVMVIAYEDFWKWASKNRQMLDFSRLERLDLGPEPDWVDIKRKADQKKKQHIPKPHNTPWGKDDDSRLKWMLSRNKYTYPQLADELKRGQAAIKRRILDLGLKARPVSLPNHSKYSESGEKQLIELLDQGYDFEVIAAKMNRSALGVRSKAERMGYFFKNGVPVEGKHT